MWSFWALPCLRSLPYWQHGQWLRNAFWWKLGCHDLGNAEKCRNRIVLVMEVCFQIFKSYTPQNDRQWKTDLDENQLPFHAFQARELMQNQRHPLFWVYCYPGRSSRWAPKWASHRFTRIKKEEIKTKEVSVYAMSGMSGYARYIQVYPHWDTGCNDDICLRGGAAAHLSEALQGGADFSEQSMDQRWHSWNMIDIEIRSRECAM